VEVPVRTGVVGVLGGDELEGLDTLDQLGAVHGRGAGVFDAEAEDVVVDPAPGEEGSEGGEGEQG
jgi:hypothetical protein